MKNTLISNGLQTLLKKKWYIIALALIAILSFGLNFYAISKIGYGNAYYAAAIKSMTESFKNFFYVSFDPAGMVSVDKPPLALWIQTLFVLVFGYHGWAMLLPQALAGTGSCIMMYVLTAKYFGRPAGLISSLVFALTPAVVVAARNNTMDMQLVFVLLVAAWFLFKSIEKSKWRYLFLCALFVGLGFNIKMLQAYMILPAVALTYLIFAKEKFAKRLLAGFISLIIMGVVSFSWVVAVDLTPSSDRPYVDSSTNNSVIELVFGHNGLERIYGQSMGGGGAGAGQNMGEGGFSGGPNMENGQGFGGPNMGTQTNGQNANTNGTPPAMPAQNGNNTGINANTNNGTAGNSGNNGTNQQFSGQGMPNGEGMPSGQGFGGGQNGSKSSGGAQGGITGNDIGTAGILRLWESGLYGQASWLIVFALFCIAVKLRKFDIKKLTLRQGVFVFWIIWLLAMYVFFSFAGFWHRYYLCMFAPAIAGIVGPGLVEMVNTFREKRGWKQFLLPISFLATFAIEIVYVWSYSALRVWLVPIMAVSAAAALVLMAFHYVNPKRLALLAATGCMLLSLLAAPFYWALTVVIYTPQNVTMPYAGPELASTATTPGMTSNQETLTTGDSGTLSLEKYLVAHYKKGSYLVVSQSADDVAQFIVDTGLPAVAYGGFLGTDNSMSLSKLKELVKEGKVTYFLVSSQNGSTNSDLISYVEKNATLIKPSAYGVSSSKSVGQSGGSLYLFK